MGNKVGNAIGGIIFGTVRVSPDQGMIPLGNKMDFRNHPFARFYGWTELQRGSFRCR